MQPAINAVALQPNAIDGPRLPPGYGVAGWGFFTDGGTPYAAVAQFALRWPALRFDLQPRPLDTRRLPMDDASRGQAAGKGDGLADMAAGEGAPCLDLDGFSGPLDLLLALARAQRIDLKRIPLPALLGQLAPALRQAVPLAERGGLLVTAAWLVLLRSRLLLPGQAPASGGTGQGRATQGGALRQARHLQRRLLELERVQALAAWLDRTPQLGRGVFGRGTPGNAASAHGAAPEVDIIAFLWACMELLDGRRSRADIEATYAPQRPTLHSVPDARTRIL